MDNILSNVLFNATAEPDECAATADACMSTKTWIEMANDERSICLRHLASQAHSQREVLRSLSEELGIKGTVVWVDEPGNSELQAFCRANRFYVSATGAFVRIITHGKVF